MTKLASLPSGPGAKPAPAWAALGGAHYLTAQVSSRVPRRYVFIDTEAHRQQTGNGEAQHWRLGVSAIVKWRDKSGTWSPVKTVRHQTSADLWQTISDAGCKHARTVVVAHNMAYDLRISDGLRWLTDNGWTISKPSLSGERISLDATKDERVLCLVDSLSVLPVSLTKLGTLGGLGKPDLPDEDASDADWWARCETDVQILARAYMIIIDWLRADDIGGWAKTGAGMGWHTLLRRHLGDKVLVHSQPDVREIEGQAMYGGRAECWRHGHLRGQKWHEWDYTMAYGNICATKPLPTSLISHLRGTNLVRTIRENDHYLYLCHAQVDQPVPVLPHQGPNGIWWPVGTFEGWYWGHELQRAIGTGAKVRVNQAYKYRATPWLAPWANWAMGVASDTSSPEATIRALAAKQWTRTVPGRSAMRYRAWEAKGDAYSPGVSYMPMLDLGTGARGAMLTLGALRWEAWATHWWSQALPQVLSAIMAYCRVNLWDAMTTAGLGHLAYVDTDCVIADDIGHSRIAAAVASGTLTGLRYKGTHDHLELIAPQLVEGSTYRRLAGLPRGAKRRTHDTYEVEVWDGLVSSLAGQRPDRVDIHHRQVQVSGTDTRRAHLANGLTEAYQVTNGVLAGLEQLTS